MARWHRWAALVCGFTGLSAIAGQPADKRIEDIAAQSEVARRGHWGAHVVNLTTGEVVYARNESQFFLPASNTKLFTTALALARLGPDYRFITRLAAPAGPDAAGVIRGDLRLVGGGDPTLSGRPVPYESKAPHGPALGPLDALAEHAWNSGLRRVEGSVIGDDSAYLWEPYPTGWAQDDTLFVYGAPVSALTLHDNAFTVSVRGGAAAGDPAMVMVHPTGDYWTISSRVATASTRQPLRLDRDAGSRTLTIWGALRPMQERSFSVAVDDPALYAAAD